MSAMFGALALVIVLCLSGPVHLQPGVYLSLGGQTITNNSYIDVDKIGINGSSALMCHTNRTSSMVEGNWHYPNGAVVEMRGESTMRDASFGINKSGSVISLFKTSGNIASSETGQFHCIILDANDNNQTLYVNIFDVQIGDNGTTPVAGDNYILNCNVFGVNATDYTVRWNNTHGMAMNGTLSFSPLLLSFGGVYMCTVTVDSRNYSRVKVVTIQIPQPMSMVITSNPVSPIHSTGCDVTLNCTVVLSSEVNSDVTTVSITWIRPNTTIIANTTQEKQDTTTAYDGNVIINSFKRTDSGNYTCIATVNTTQPYVEDEGIRNATTSTLITTGVYISKDGMTVQNNSNVIYTAILRDDVTNGDSTLVCHSDSLVDASCAEGDWYLSNGYSEDDVFTATQTGKCTVELYRTKNAINFTLTSYLETLCCIIPDINGMNQSVCINTVPPITIDGILPILGDSYNLTCEITTTDLAANDNIIYQWRKQDAVSTETGPTLSFSSLELSDAGLYVCSATINAKTYDKQHNLRLKIPDPVINASRDKSSPVGSNFSLTCTVQLDPAMMNFNLSLYVVEVNITMDETRVTDANSTVTEIDAITYNYTTTISSFEVNDTGNYTCIAAVRSRSRFLNDSDIIRSSTLTVTTGAYLSLNELVIKNNTNIAITTIGVEDNEALLCLTDFYQFNENSSGSVGVWYSPNNSVVQEQGDIYVSRGNGVVRLHREENVTMPTGCYLCVIPDASTTNQTLHVILTLPETTQHPSPPTSTPTSASVTSTTASITSSTPVPMTSSAPASITTSIETSTTTSASVTSTPQTSTVAIAVAGALVSALLLLASGVILAFVIIKRRKYKRKEPVSGVKVEYIYEDRYSEPTRDVPTPEAEEESRDEWIVETNQPDNTEESKGEAIELTECESKDEDQSEDVKREDEKTEDMRSEEPRREDPCDTCEASSPTEETDASDYGKVVPVSEFTNHVESFHADRDKLFEKEYTSISRYPQSAISVAKIGYNKLKNRFANILPYDETRVKLQEIEGEEGSDYINANHLNGYDKPQAYIAAQGPMPNTVKDFWRMIWEYKLSTIVMLTRCFEGRVKCEAYWPHSVGEVKDVGHDLNVVHISELPFTEYYVRKMRAEHIDGTTLDIIQYHFIGWPDHGVPKNGIGLINFIKRVRKLHPYSDPRPLLVHCSAGVGRSGAFIVLDSMMERMKTEDTLNIHEFVSELRTQRVLMVQTQVQYNFIHDVLNEMLLTGDTEILATNFRIVLNQLSTDNEGETGYSKQLRIIGQVVPKASEADYSHATTETNRSKNRYQNVLPNDHYRVMLRAIAELDYINASFIDGYSQRGAYIATQMPLKNTVNDFWKMIWEYQIRSVVVLCQMEEDMETYRDILPEGEEGTETYGKVIVKVLSRQPMTDYEVKQVELCQDNSSERKEVTVFHYLNWSEDGRLEGKSTLLELIEQVNRKQMGSGNKPITVVCNDGIGRSGTFIAIHAQLERLKTEGVVDFFQFVKSARFQRAELVPEVTHYMVCHDVVAEYLDKFDIYANFKGII